MYFTITNEYGSISYFDNDEEMVKQRLGNVFFEQEYVLSYLKRYVESASVILDIGAHCGSHTVLYKSINPSARVYAFEPQLKMYHLLVKNIKDNGLTEVVAYNNAVGDFTGNAEMNPYSSDGSNSMSPVSYGGDNLYNLAGIQIGAGGESVKMIRLDEMILPCCNFMKIDVEGFEPHVIEGARQMIENCRPVISYEVNHKVSDRATVSSTEILESLGYECSNLWSDNWIAIPN